MENEEHVVETPWGKLVTAKGLKILLNSFSNDINRLHTALAKLDDRMNKLELTISLEKETTNDPLLVSSLTSVEKEIQSLAAHIKTSISQDTEGNPLWELLGMSTLAKGHEGKPDLSRQLSIFTQQLQDIRSQLSHRQASASPMPSYRSRVRLLPDVLSSIAAREDARIPHLDHDDHGKVTISVDTLIGDGTKKTMRQVAEALNFRVLQIMEY